MPDEFKDPYIDPSTNFYHMILSSRILEVSSSVDIHETEHGTGLVTKVRNAARLNLVNSDTRSQSQLAIPNVRVQLPNLWAVYGDDLYERMFCGYRI